MKLYKIGDTIQWGGNDIGEPHLTEVKVYGILDSDECPLCKKDNAHNEYDIFIFNDIIKDVRLMSNIEDYFEGDGNYKICKSNI
ncbi:hypothetical protein [Niabella aquatica]